MARSLPPDVVVMIHGAGGGAWEYQFWKPEFEHAGWKVVVPELEPAAGGLAATHFADYVAQVRHAVLEPHRRLVLVGASMGGILALAVAAREHPDAVVLVDSVPPAHVGPSRPHKPYPAIMHWANGPLKDTEDAMPDSDPATIQWAYKRWRDESGAVLNEISQGIAVEKPRVPVLVVIGSKDTDIPPSSGLALAEWASADVQLYRGASHVGPLMGRRAAAIADSVVDWLRHRMPASVLPAKRKAAALKHHENGCVDERLALQERAGNLKQYIRMDVPAQSRTSKPSLQERLWNAHINGSASRYRPRRSCHAAYSVAGRAPVVPRDTAAGHGD
jgi:pimeloyl-ACP methyl ester carboxylesterase